MTSRLPSNRLVDVLRQNSPRMLQQHADAYANAYASIPPEAVQTRFLRNHFLISPKSLYLLSDPDTLARYGCFAVYKPPFCPMRRAEAKDNYHNVSVESFVEAAFKSRNVFPTLCAAGYAPEDMRLRVLNDIAPFESGPVVVSVSEAQPFARSLAPFIMRYDVLVAGHLPLTTAPKDIPVTDLFPSTSAEKDSDAAAAGAAPTETTCEYTVKLNGYYAVHAVSLLEVVVTAPPTALPPALCAFVARTLDTYVIGDPVAMGDLLSDAAGEKGSHPAAALTPSSTGSAAIAKGVALRGDCDFPRVFSHLREVSIAVEDRDARGQPVATAPIEFHCRKCIDPLVKRSREYSLKAVQIRLLDGSWTPEAEYL